MIAMLFVVDAVVRCEPQEFACGPEARGMAWFGCVAEWRLTVTGLALLVPHEPECLQAL